MQLKSQCGFLRERPFGGVVIVWRKTISHVIEIIFQDTEDRAITINLNVNIGLWSAFASHFGISLSFFSLICHF